MEVFSIASRGAWKDADESSASEQRNARRVPAAEMPSISGVRLLPDDVAATLVNISTTGLLVEAPSALRPDLKIRIRFEGTFSPALVPGRVVRCTVSSMGPDGALRYHLGVEFNSPIALADPALAAVPTAPAVGPLAPAAVPTAPAVGPLAPTAGRLRNRW
jgi:hypothetical protein